MENALALYVDVTKRKDVESMMQSATAHYGQIDVVINNTLVDFKFDPVIQKSFIDLQCEDYQKQLDGTLNTAFHVIQSVMPQFMERHSGSIISIGTNLYKNSIFIGYFYSQIYEGV